ncbi:MAG TPA: hypothetical protein VH560_19370 [Polyangia bacterium]|jgi:hypothetical protein|nr:hypothetical protein [Polyangia bacterium]
MTREIILSILESEGAESKGGTLAFRDDREVTAFVSAPGEILNVARVVRVELKDKFVALQTTKDERFVFAYEDVLGFKFATAINVKDRSAGFGR